MTLFNSKKERCILYKVEVEDEEQKVIWYPYWILKIKGKIDSKKGRGVCDAFINRLIKKESCFESNETIAAEQALANTRKAGAKILVRLSEKKQFISNPPNEKSDKSTQSIKVGRNAKVQFDANINIAKNAVAVEELAVINETIIYVDTVLEERIKRIRDNTDEICHVYISGVRSGKIPNYDFSLKDYNDNAIKIYHNKHIELDEKIRNAVRESIKGEDV